MSHLRGNGGPARRLITGIGEVSPSNPLPVELWGAGSGFSGQRIYEIDPRIAIEYVYDASNARIVTETTANGGSVTPENNAATLATSTASNGSARVESTKRIRYTPPVSGYVTFSGKFNTGTASSRQTAGIGTTSDGYGVGYNGESFGVFRLKNSTYTWTPQANFSEDALDGNGPSGVTIDPTKGNLFMVEYQWHGYGSIRHFFEHPDHGVWSLFHVEPYNNANTEVSTQLASLPVFAEIANTGNTSDLSMQLVALSGGTMGKTSPATSLHNGYSARKTSVSTTAVPVLTIRNKATFNSYSHGVGVLLGSIDVLVETANRDIKIELIRNTTLGGSPSYSDIDTNTSVVEVDTAGTTVSGGYIERVFLEEGAGSAERELRKYQIEVPPGETMTIAATQVSAAGATDLQVSLNWEELW